MEVTQIILIVFILLLVIAYPILVSSRNKKETQKMQEQTNSLKRGDRVLTSSGVYGTIVDLEMTDEKKIVTIETGSGKNKGYVSVDAYAIYTVFKDEPAKPAEEKKVDAKLEAPAEAKVEAPAAEVKAEPKSKKKAAKAEPKAEEKAEVKADEKVAEIEAKVEPSKKPAKKTAKK